MTQVLGLSRKEQEEEFYQHSIISPLKEYRLLLTLIANHKKHGTNCCVKKLYRQFIKEEGLLGLHTQQAPGPEPSTRLSEYETPQGSEIPLNDRYTKYST